MENLDLRFLVAVILRSDASLFARLRLHSAKVLEQLSVDVYAVTATESFESFPARREHFLTMLDWLECNTPSLYGQSLQTMCKALMDRQVSYESRAVFLSLMLPAILALPLHESVISAPIALLKTERCTSPLIVVKSRATRPLCMTNDTGAGASTAIVVAESFAILRDIGSGKLPAAPCAIAGAAGCVPSGSAWGSGVSWTDVCEIASTFGTAVRLGKRAAALHMKPLEMQTLDAETRAFVKLQLQAFEKPTVYIPRDEQGKGAQKQTLALVEKFEPWAGPYSADRLANSLWRNKITGEIVSHDDMMRSVFDAAPLIGGTHFAMASVSESDANMLLGGGHEEQALAGGSAKGKLAGGSIRGGSVTDQILNRVLGDDKTLPKTFSIVPEGRMFQTWTLGETLEDVSFASAKLTEEQVKGILFQIVWTLAVLQKEFQGFQHNTLSKSIRLVRFGKTRCYRVTGGSGSGVTFCIPPSVPLPIVTQFATANGLAAPLPLRPSGTFDDQADLVDVLDVMTKHTFAVEAFAAAHELRKVCRENCAPARLIAESAVDKSAQIMVGNQQTTLQQFMFVDAFDVFVSRAGPSSSALAQVETL